MIALVQLYVLLLAFQQTATAQTPVDSFVTKPIRGRGVLSVKTEIQIPGSMSYGYAKVLIKDMKGISSADRDLVVVLYVKDWGGSGISIGYRYPVRLPEGQASAEVQIPFVGIEDRQAAWDVAVYENGNDIEDKTNQNANQASYQWIFNPTPIDDFPIGCLIAAGEDPATELQKVLAVSPASNRGGAVRGTIAGQVMPANPVANSETLRVADASDDWRRYYPYSMWWLSADAVAEINQQRPTVAAALRTYVAAGGTLFVHEAKSAKVVEEINRLLNISATNSLYTPWSNTTDRNKESDGLKSIDEEKYAGTIMSRPYANGRILLSSASSESIETAHLDSVISKGNFGGWRLPSRGFDGNWFWRNMIGSVGKPPIWFFVGMVTLFGALLGPGLLHLTGRLKRRSLMIFLVPVCSLVATLLIIGYGVLHEGFETYIRISSVTVYDAPSNVAFAWSRQNYFSGLPPREGLVFPEQAFVRPVYADSDSYYSGSPDPRQGVRCTVEVTDQQVWKGWLLPRQHQQLLVGHAIDASTIPIALARGESNSVIVKNLTDQTLPIVVARGEADNYFTAVDLKPQEERVCQVEDKVSAARIVSRIGADARPKIPVEMQGSSGNLLSFGRSSRMASSRLNEVDDVINATYRRTMTDVLGLESFEFAALVPIFDPIAMPLEGQQSQSVNLVTGVSPW